MIGIFAVMAVALAMVGAYGVAAHAAERRRREIAVRMALGATRAASSQLVLREGAALTVVGVLAALLPRWRSRENLENAAPRGRSARAMTFAAVAAMIGAVARRDRHSLDTGRPRRSDADFTIGLTYRPTLRR